MEIPRIKALCLDIYGTVLATQDYDNNLPPRKGIKEMFDLCDRKKILVIATSDAYVPNVKAELENCFAKYPDSGVGLERLFYFMQLDEWPKDYSKVAGSLGIRTCEIVAVGDSERDILGAQKHGCFYILCPEYEVDGERDFDLGKELNSLLDNLEKYAEKIPSLPDNQC